MPAVTIDSRQWFYARHGHEGRSVVFLHGAGGNHLVWPPALRRLDGTTTYAVDLPGHGKSEGEGEASVTAYTEGVAGFLRAVRIPRAVIVGHSMGGAIAQQLALTYPEVVQGLVLISTSARLPVAPALLEGLQSNFPAALELVSQWALGPDATADVRELSLLAMQQAGSRLMHGDFAACSLFDVRDRLGDIAVPTLVVCGTEDRMTPLKYAERLASGIPRASLVAVEGAGHMVMLENPAAVREALLGFLRGFEV